MKKILYVISKSEIGGAQNWVYEQKKLLENEYEIVLITSANGWLTNQFSKDNVFYIRGLSQFYNIFNLFYLIHLIYKISPDVVIASSASAGIYSRLSKLFFNFKCIYVSHGWSCIYNGGFLGKLFCKIEKILSFLSDKILCVSHMDEVKAIKKIGIKKDKIITIPNAVSQRSLREKNSNVKKILFVGRLTYPKRPDLLLSIMNDYPDILLDIVGGGEYLLPLKEEYGFLENINFLGEIEYFDKYRDYDIFILCSESEGLPMSAIEAGSAGLPLLLSNVGGCSELINSECKNGELFDNTVDSLKNSLNMIIIQYERYQDNAIKSVSKFDIMSYKKDYIALIED